MVIQVGDRVPNATFPYVPYTSDLENPAACGTRSQYDIATQWASRRVVVIAVPGAFTPTCHVNHLPGFVNNYDQFRAGGIDVIAVIAANDPFVMSGWARVAGLGDRIVALTDTGAEWSNSMGLAVDLSAHGLGTRTNRYALILDDLVVEAIQVEEAPSKLERTGAEHLLALL